MDTNPINLTIQGMLAAAVAWLVNDRKEVQKAHTEAMTACQKNIETVSELAKDVTGELRQAQKLIREIRKDAEHSKK